MQRNNEHIPLTHSTLQNKESLVSGTSLSWSHLRVEIQGPNLPSRLLASGLQTFKQNKQKHEPSVLLCDITGMAQQGQVLAIMGTSGAGAFFLENFLYSDSFEFRKDNIDESIKWSLC